MVPHRHKGEFAHTIPKELSFPMNLQYFYRLAIAAAVLGYPATLLTAQSTGDSNATITSLTNLSRPRRDPTPLGRVDGESSDAVNLDVSGDPNRDGRQTGSTRRSYLNQTLLSAKLMGSGTSQNSNGSPVYSQGTSLRSLSSVAPNSSAASRSPLQDAEKQQTSKAALDRRGWSLQSSEIDTDSFFKSTEKTPIAGIVHPASTSGLSTTDTVPNADFESLERLKDPFSGLLTDRLEGFKKLDLEQPCGSGCRLKSNGQLNSPIGLEAPRSDHPAKRVHSYNSQAEQGAEFPAPELKPSKE